MKRAVAVGLSALLLFAAVRASADPFAAEADPAVPTPNPQTHRLTGLLSSPSGRLAIVQHGTTDTWWILQPGDSVPGTGWRFVGIAAGRGLFTSADAALQLALWVGADIGQAP